MGGTGGRYLAGLAAAAAVLLVCDRSRSQPHDGCPRIVGRWEIVGGGLAAGGGRTIPIGGISDLHFTAATAGRPATLWAVTDRGPNALVRGRKPDAGGKSGKLRTLLAPDFVPSLLELDAACLEDDAAIVRGTMAVRRVVPLSCRSGQPVSGRPNGIGRDEPAHTADGLTLLPPDPDGVDTEGVVAVGDDGFWLVEEYRPSILRVAADGRLIARYVPDGHPPGAAHTDVIDCLPAHFAERADNRGFEAVALTPDARRLFVLLQSPLDRAADEAAGVVPLLEFDAAAGAPVAEHRYVLDTADGDGKLCAMACLAADSLIVLEQADGGVKRLQRIDLGSTPVRKTLVADLSPLVPAMLADVQGDDGPRSSAGERGPLKIEGLAIIDERRVLLANDNDFGVGEATGESATPPRSCLWLIELPTPLPSEPST